MLENRLRWLGPLIILGFALLLLRLVELQVLRHEASVERVRENVTRLKHLPALRGDLSDRNGEVVATDRPVQDVYVHPAWFQRRRFERLAEALGLEGERRRRVEALLEGRRGRWVKIAEDIDPDQRALLEASSEEQRGVEIRVRPQRTYPLGPAAAHLLGYVNEITADELSRLQRRGYHRGDVIGRVGVERAYEEELRGQPGWLKVAVDARGFPLPDSIVEMVLGEDRALAPRPGRDVVLSIDASLQRRVDAALSEQVGAAAVVIEVETGQILALVSRPTFEPEEMVSGLSALRARRLLSASGAPLFNRALRGYYSPGEPLSSLEGFGPIDEVRATVTVLEMAMSAAAIANGGALYQPQLVIRVQSSEGDLIREVQPLLWGELQLSPARRTELIEEMVASAEELGLAGDGEGTVAGVTGVGEGRTATGDHSWFVGFAPVEAPQVAIALLIEGSDRPRETAVPAALEILRAASSGGGG